MKRRSAAQPGGHTVGDAVVDLCRVAGADLPEREVTAHGVEPRRFQSRPHSGRRVPATWPNTRQFRDSVRSGDNSGMNWKAAQAGLRELLWEWDPGSARPFRAEEPGRAPPLAAAAARVIPSGRPAAPKGYGGAGCGAPDDDAASALRNERQRLEGLPHVATQ